MKKIENNTLRKIVAGATAAEYDLVLGIASNISTWEELYEFAKIMLVGVQTGFLTLEQGIEATLVAIKAVLS